MTKVISVIAFRSMVSFSVGLVLSMFVKLNCVLLTRQKTGP